jgi:hypothetical protein
MKRPYRPSNEIADVSAALDAMNAEELRTFVGQAFASLDEGPRSQLEDVPGRIETCARSARGRKELNRVFRTRALFGSETR